MATAGISFGRYTLLRKLGSGGMGEVYLARQAGPAGFERLVALKQLLPELSGDAALRQLFLDEARIAGTLSHPGISHIYELGEVGGTWFMALEYVFGEDLARVRMRAMEHAGGVPVPYAARIVADLCAGLDYAHNRKDEAGRPLGIVHRDVSPQNVLVSFDGQVKLVDFGIARAVLAKIGTSGQVRGKLAYMAPEQLEPDATVDGRADVYGAGCVLRELCAEKGEPPPALARAIALATSADLSERPTAAALQDLLEGYLQEERWRIGQRELAAYMVELFGERAAAAVPSVEGTATATVTLDEVLGYLEGARLAVRTPVPELAERTVVGAAPSVGSTQRSQAGDGADAGLEESTAGGAAPTVIAELPGGGATTVEAIDGAAGPTAVEQLPAVAVALATGPRLPPRALLLALAAGAGLAVAGIVGLALSAGSEQHEEAPLPSTPGAGVGPGLLGVPSPGQQPAPLLRLPEPGERDAGTGAEPPTALSALDDEVELLPAPLPAPKAAAARTPAQGSGELTIDTQPWSEVRIGKRKLGITPLAHFPLKAGSYTLELANPELGLRVTRKVKIRPGEETVVRAKL